MDDACDETEVLLMKDGGKRGGDKRDGDKRDGDKRDGDKHDGSKLDHVLSILILIPTYSLPDSTEIQLSL